MSNTYNVGWLRDNENQIFIPFTYTKSVKLDDKGNTLDSTVTLVDEHTDAIAGINETLEKIQNGNIHAGIADSTKGTLSIGNKHFNGSENLTVEAKDLGITGALVYRGISTTPITDKGTEAPFIDNATVAITDLEPGNIVLYNANGEIYQEYLWTGNHWELLGDEGSYAYRSITVEAGAGLTGGGTLAQDFGLSVVPDNHTVVIDDNNRVAMKQLTSAGSYGQEADIPDLEPQATREFKVPYFTVDDYGRITSAQTKTIQIVNDSEVMDAIARIEADIAGDSGEVDNIVPRLAQVETRTKYIDASSDEGVFQIVDGEGKIGVQVDDQGVKSFDFILSNGNVSLVQKLKALDEKDTALTDGISDIEARTVTAGAGLTGGGSLADSMTINIGKGTGIQINEDSIQLEAVENLSTGSFGESENYTKGFNNSFTIPHITVDEYGRITAVKSVTINMPQDGAILDNISKVEEDLTKLINDTKTELQGNIDNVNTTLDSKIDNVNTTLNSKIDNVKSTLDKKDEELSDTLGKEVTALNNTITEQVNALSERINTNKTNIESNDIDIGNLDQRVSANEKEIEDIHKLDDEQNDNISNLETRAANLETRTQFMDASSPDAFQITDEEGYVGFSVDTAGIAKAAYDFYIPEGDISLRGLDSALDAEIKTRTEEVKALQDKDIELNDALTDLIDETKKDLQDEIDSDVDALASELRQKDSDLDTKIDNLATELRAKDDALVKKDEELSDAINAISDNKIIAGDGLILDNTGTLSEESITISAQVDRGLDISSDKIGHTNSITAGSVSGTSGSVNTSITIPKITYDAQGHITKTETTTADLSGITDSINQLDEDLNDKISETEEGLLEKISEVETELKSKSILYNPGTIQVDLESNDAITYTDGGNITPGVLGILQPEHGGIGNTSGRIQIGQVVEKTIGTNATSEGYNTNASGSYSHAEGYNTNAIGNYSHAEGYGTVASGNQSHAGGYNTKASGNCSTIFGERNDGKTISISGSANALTYSINLSASLSSENLSGSVSSSGLFTSAALPAASSSSPSSFTTKQTRVYTLNGGRSYLYKSSYYSSSGGTYFTPEIYLFSSRTGNNFSGLRKTYQANTNVTETIVVPENSTYYIVYQSSWSTYAKRTSSTSSGYVYYYTSTGSYGSARGTPTIKEVINTEDITPYQNGYFSTGQRIISVSIADNTITLDRTLSSSSITDKNYTIYFDRGAKGSGSFVVGLNNSAQGEYQTVIGKNNLEDTTSAFIVGNGTVDQKSNAYTIDWNGNSIQTGTNTSTDFIIVNEEKNISLLTKLQTYENEIDNIHIANEEQNDQLADHDGRLITVETRTQFMDASTPDEFHITDEEGYPGFTFGSDGIARAQDFVTSSTTEEDNNISLKETKKALDAEIKNREEKDTELADAIDDTNLRIDKMDITAGHTKQPIYFNNGIPTACVENFTFYEEIGADDVDPSTSSTFCVLKTGDTMSGPLISTGFIGPLTGNATSADKATADGAGNNIINTYATQELVNSKLYVPAGGSTGHVLIKNSDTNGDASWKELVALPKGGSAGQYLVKNSTTDGDADWQNLPALNYMVDKQFFGGSGQDFNTLTQSGVYRLGDCSQDTNAPNCSWGQMLVLHSEGDTINQIAFDWGNPNVYLRGGNPSDVGGSGAWSSWKRMWCEGNSITGAVWNDYAECRESDCEGYGYVLMENGDDTLSKTTERLSHFAGISSDTWGFSQGETARARTPIAVAGRVLAYPYQNRNNYKPGDCVCAGPGGTVDIMTREEIINWPDRIVGTVSCVPEYEEWGGGKNADRPSVKVNGRIWIKVK